MSGRVQIALSAAVPLAIFGVLYGVLVYPQRTAFNAARDQVAAVRADDARREAGARAAAGAAAGAHTDGDASELLRAIANSAEARGARNLSIDVPTGTVSFDAGDAQVEEVFRNLPFLPGPFKLREVGLAPAAPAGLMHVTLRLGSGNRVPALPSAPSPRVATPAASVAAIQRPPADPEVQSILVSTERRVALVDGRLVRVGDSVGSSRVRAIEQGAVILGTDEGGVKRLELKRAR